MATRDSVLFQLTEAGSPSDRLQSALALFPSLSAVLAAAPHAEPLVALLSMCLPSTHSSCRCGVFFLSQRWINDVHRGDVFLAAMATAGGVAPLARVMNEEDLLFRKGVLYEHPGKLPWIIIFIEKYIIFNNVP